MLRRGMKLGEMTGSGKLLDGGYGGGGGGGLLPSLLYVGLVCLSLAKFQRNQFLALHFAETEFAIVPLLFISLQPCPVGWGIWVGPGMRSWEWKQKQ